MIKEERSFPAKAKQEVQKTEEPTTAGRYYSPSTDIFETKNELVVIMDMPGVKKDDVHVKLERGVLEVEGIVDCSGYQELSPVYTEYNVGNFKRSFSLSSRIEQDKISAVLNDGVLTLKLPKTPEAVPRRIAVV